MYDPKLYQDGIAGVLLVEWTLRCETPLVIRNGQCISYREDGHPKERNKDVSFAWLPSDRSDARSVAALCYGYSVEGDTLELLHQVPPGSVRGSLRSWTIEQVISRDAASSLLPAKGEDKDQKAARQKALQEGLCTSSTGLPLLASLFGMALEASQDERDYSNAGRLRVETEPFPATNRNQVNVSGQDAPVQDGPTNAALHMMVRNPLDRVTQAARKGGLHHFLEFARGQQFTTRLRILNPRPSDVGLLSVWRREIDAGMLRLGALSAIGRGRLGVAHEHYMLWALATRLPDCASWPGLAAATGQQDDALKGLYVPYDLPITALEQYEACVTEEVSANAC